MGIEYSLSCPQGGDGTEGDIVSQNAELTAKIIDWVMEISDPEVPKLFKLTGAVTSIYPIANAIKKVFAKYPKKKAGITLANTFPTFHFQNRKDRVWEDGVVIGMSGAGVTPISNLNLNNVYPLKLHVSGNGGPMDYKAAADFLALGVQTVQFCTVATKYGYGIYNELCNGVSEIMQERGIKSMKQLIGIAFKGGSAVVDFMDLSPIKRISDCNTDLCEKCGNCTRCPYQAITFDDKGFPTTDPSKCVGCGICALKCFSGALSLRKRTKKELELLKED
jgi:dihydropyrimidine dehydrogenase (NAD+) subunit PreA